MFLPVTSKSFKLDGAICFDLLLRLPDFCLVFLIDDFLDFMNERLSSLMLVIKDSRLLC